MIAQLRGRLASGGIGLVSQMSPTQTARVSTILGITHDSLQQFSCSWFPVQQQQGWECGLLEVGIAGQTCSIWWALPVVVWPPSGQGASMVATDSTNGEPNSALSMYIVHTESCPVWHQHTCSRLGLKGFPPKILFHSGQNSAMLPLQWLN